MLKLEESNIDTLQEDIPMNELPTLFKDAMYMTCQLGIKYIWIDCLCILQGTKTDRTKADWEFEATRMGDYYRYAQCNLSASGYEDSSLGLFGQRMALSLVNYPIQTDFFLPEEEDRFEGIYIKADFRHFEEEILEGPLGSRGWIAQERALSPGILHFTPRQMWWECTEHVVNEAFPAITLPWYGARRLGAGAVRSIDATSSFDEISKSWQGFAGRYASTNLTYETDRFPAVIGIARIYAALLDDKFIAGMWERDLVRELVWEPLKKAKRIPSAHTIAPSWSWASLSLAHLTPPRATPINEVRFQVLWEVPDFESDLQATTFDKSSVRGLAMTGPLRRLSVNILDLPYWRESARLWIKYDVEDAPLFSGQNTAGQEWRWKDPTHVVLLSRDTESTFGLLLQQVPGAEPEDTFRRLGMVEFCLFPHDECDKYIGLVKENGIYKPSVVFEECGFQDFVLI